MYNFDASNPSLIEAINLKIHFHAGGLFSIKHSSVVHAVDGVNITINRGETLGLVGESGCGKTTLGKALLGLIPPTAGKVFFNGIEIYKLKNKKEIKKLRREMQMIFQNPFASLNPRKKIGQILSRPYLIYNLANKTNIRTEIIQLLELVGLSPAQLYIDRYPHEQSGGQRQRIAIARAIATRPMFVVADEPVTALDISIRAGILNLLKNLQREFKLTYMYITHDLAVVRSLCNRVAVMYAGKIVEQGEVEELYSNPLHPYTQSILAATPIPNPRETRKRKSIILKGEPPSLINPPMGCRFHPRCSYAMSICAKENPELIDVGNRHYIACHLVK